MLVTTLFLSLPSIPRGPDPTWLTCCHASPESPSGRRRRYRRLWLPQCPRSWPPWDTSPMMARSRYPHKAETLKLFSVEMKFGLQIIFAFKNSFASSFVFGNCFFSSPHQSKISLSSFTWKSLLKQAEERFPFSKFYISLFWLHKHLILKAFSLPALSKIFYNNITKLDTIYTRKYEHLAKACFHCSPTIFVLGAAEVICGQPEVQLPHHQTDSSQLSRQRVPTLQTQQLLLHLAP